MFTASSMLFIYVESPLHAGTGRSLGAVDLPIQRERTTGYPMVQGSGIKGQLRAVVKNKLKDKEEWLAMFGPETGDAIEHAGALSIGDARLLLFPVRSLNGVFAWTTSPDVLARFVREAAFTGIQLPFDISKLNPSSEKALVGSKQICSDSTLVLEEFSFDASVDEEVSKIGEWLASNALPQTEEYTYWRNHLPKKLCVISDDAFRDFALYATEVQTHIKINQDTKTVEEGALWTTEMLPIDTLLYGPLMATDSYRKGKEDQKGSQMLGDLKNLAIQRIHLGGDTTTGQGMVALKIM
jgi:CRISPR-associated protein Cmr4